MSTVFKGCCVRDCGWWEMKLPKTFLVPLLQPLKRIRCHHVNDSARWGGNQRLFICSNVRGKNSSASGDAETEIFFNAEILKESERWLNTAWSARGLDKILDWKLMIKGISRAGWIFYSRFVIVMFCASIQIPIWKYISIFKNSLQLLYWFSNSKCN